MSQLFSHCIASDFGLDLPKGDINAKRFTEDLNIGILKQVEAGLKIINQCRMHGISDTTIST
jgi:hypothetical protein